MDRIEPTDLTKSHGLEVTPASEPPDAAPPMPPLAWPNDIDPERIPQAMREVDQWVEWQFEPDKNRPGEWKKVPMRVGSNLRASTTDARTWGSFKGALEGARASNGTRGIGFVFSAEDDFAGIDLDDCRDPVTGVLVPAAQAILDQFNTYAEVSPSGTGVKLFLRGQLPSSKGKRSQALAAEGIPEAEAYDHGRYFTVTGQSLMDTPCEVRDCQEPLSEFWKRLDVPKAKAAPKKATRPKRSRDPLSDDQVIELASTHTGREKFLSLFRDGDTAPYGGNDSSADMALANRLAFWTGGNAAQMDSIFRQSALFREKWDEKRGAQTYGEITIQAAIEATPDTYGGGRPLVEQRETPVPSILVNTREQRVVEAVVEALANDPDLYQRGGEFVHVIDDTLVNDGGVGPRIRLLPAAVLRSRITEHSQLLIMTNKGEKDAHPPGWLVSAVDDLGVWPKIRYLDAISEVPVFRPDGTLWQTPGYDAATRTLFVPRREFPPLPSNATHGDALRSLDVLSEVVVDFRFEKPSHKSAWLAAVLTAIARSAIPGCTPMFLVDANVRGAGKGKLAQTVSLIAYGRMTATSTYSSDAVEMRKSITAHAIDGAPLILFDNVVGEFGNAALDQAITTVWWKDRILGHSEHAELPLTPVWMATGNNVVVSADSPRRIVPIRLDVLEERPEERTGFAHSKLEAWVEENRQRLYIAAATITIAFIKAGRPQQSLTPFGSFEGWSDLVRQAIVWLGLPDPCSGRTEMIKHADSTTDLIAQLIEAFEAFDPKGEGVVIPSLLRDLYASGVVQIPERVSQLMKVALEGLVGARPGQVPDARQVGNRFKSVRRRVCNDKYIDQMPVKSREGWRWRVYSTSDDGVPPPPVAGSTGDPDIPV